MKCLRILSAAGIFIGMAYTWGKCTRQRMKNMEIAGHACVQDVNSDFVCAGWCNFDVLELERLACAPAHSSLAFNGFPCGAGHGGLCEEGPVRTAKTEIGKDFTRLAAGPGRARNLMSFTNLYYRRVNDFRFSF